MVMINWLFGTLILYSSGSGGGGVPHHEHEKALRDTVLKGYENKIRPNSTVLVKVRFSLLNINVLDVPTQRLSVSGWLTFTWEEPRLTWRPADYGGILDIFDTELVYWRPEIIVDNSVSNLGVLESDKLLIRVTYVGNMTWEPPGIFETHCDVDVTFYPFDTQVCVVEVASWAYTMSEVDLEADEAHIYLVDYVESGEWTMLSTWSERKELIDGEDMHSEIAFSMKLQRKPQYYVTTILIPVIVTSILCVLVFLLPAESGEKVGYSLTILLTYTVMLTLVASYLPPTSKHTSVLGVYLTIILFIGVFSTFLSVLIIMLHHRQRDEVPKWLKTLTSGCLAPIARWKYSGGAKNRVGAYENERQTVEIIGGKVHIDSKTHISADFNSYSRKRNGHSTAAFVSQRQTHRQTAVGIGSHKFLYGQTKGAIRNTVSDQMRNTVSDQYYLYDNLSEHRTTVGGQGLTYGKQRKNGPGGKEEKGPPIDYGRFCGEHDFTWQEVAAILDAVCLRVLGLIVFILTVAVLLALIIGGYATL